MASKEEEGNNAIFLISISTENFKQAKLILPFEFTCEGMLERLNAYIENQDFCDKSYHWPLNNDDLRISISRAGESCTDKCFREGLTCEPEYFFVLNSSKISKCAQVVYEKSNVAPAKEVVTSKCVLQQEPLLFSCAAHNSSYRRFCPCRSYRKQQISLCGSCF
ncbi:Alpha-1,6-mannosylglycoprotein 6-beta-N-acetylglucosaminyltransferase B [Stylophora pistillata]|uniref:alpha-1,6-mannosyl-glycoprotein 6-beta-N-acetylglucosaminyltransferase n=1 Tax=Stylophora pistillata TaxID=50429 RepID=A0A2B4S4N7_STYPI|nr:Alpha-1,6-mannosylglycoprotein 6-beta-N-acetylglucosaminyltransferase B [Stylophora pistillata]